MAIAARHIVGLARGGVLSMSLYSDGELVLGSPVYITGNLKSYRENDRKWAKALTKYMAHLVSSGFALSHFLPGIVTPVFRAGAKLSLRYEGLDSYVAARNGGTESGLSLLATGVRTDRR
jgi:hypothetical protein